MREALTKKRFGVPALLLIAILLTAGIIAAAYIYCVNISFVVRQNMNPSTVNVDLGTFHADAESNATFSKDFDTIGTCTTWTGKNVTITQTNDLTSVFENFTVTVQLDKKGNGWDKTDGDVQVSADLKDSGSTMTWHLANYNGTAYDVYLKVDGTFLDDLDTNVATGSAHLEFSFPE